MGHPACAVFMLNIAKKVNEPLFLSRFDKYGEVNVMDMVYCAKWNGLIFTTHIHNSGRNKLYFVKL